MKKIIFSLITIFALFIIVGCTPSVEQVEIPKEILQEYIYELAVKEGYEGAYDEWLESIRGEAGKDGKSVELSTTPTHIIWRYTDSSEWKKLVALEDLKGTDGKSAYEVAKDYGYKGTIEEWLNSLKGTNGVNGINGKEIELSTNTTHIVWKYNEDTEWKNLVSLSLLTTSVVGERGKSAYEIAVELGFDGTINEWIESLKGQNGHTPVISIIEGYWHVDGINTNVQAVGSTGNGIKSIELLSTNGLVDTYKITFTDNTSTTFTVTNGKDGTDGISIENVLLTEDGNLEVKLSSGTTLNLGNIKGQNGINGTSIKEANINANGELELTLTDNTVINVGKIVGEDGEQGLTGIGIKSIKFDQNNNLIITLTDDTEVNCGKVPTCNHIFNDWTNEIKVTCTSIGVDTRECTICGLKDYKFTEELEHEFTEWKTLISTCTEHKESRTCTTCNKVELRDAEIDTNKHSYNNDVCENCGNSNALAGFTFTLLEDDTYELTSCKSLATYIEIPSTYEGKEVTSIGERAFSNCVLLYNIFIPDTITKIGSHAFNNCLNILEVEIPNSVLSIGFSAFENCDSLKKISIPFIGASVDSPEYTNFGYIFGTSSYSSHKTYIPESLKEVIITGGTSIGENSFYECTSLTSIEIPNTITNIEKSAFLGCENIKKFIIPDSVENIGISSFQNCTSLEEIVLPFVGTSENATAYKAVFGAIFGYRSEQTSTASYTTYSEEFINSAFNSDGIDTGIWQYSCANYKYNTNSYRGNSYYYFIPSSLKNIIITKQVNIPIAAFNNCDFIENIVFSKTLETIGSYAFQNCLCFSELEIPNSVTSIGSYAFSGCTSLTSIEIPNSVTSIGYAAFKGCTSLTSLTIPFVGDTLNETENTHFGYIFGASSYSSNNSNVPSSTKEVIVTGGTSIGQLAFYNCTSLESIEIPNSVTSIGSSAFSGCTSLTSIKIPNSVTNIGSYAFKGCTNLTSIEIPNSVTSIGSSAFSGCTSLTSIEIPNSVTSIGSSVFYNCTSLTSVEIPNSVTSIGSDAFCNCTKLTSIEIPNSVTTISSYAFSGCTNLTSIEIPNSVTIIGSNAFYNCTKLTIYCEAKSKPSGWSSDWNYSNCPVVWDYKNQA